MERAALVTLVLVVGCTPLTRYRQSLVVPPAEPPVAFGTPLPVGQLAVGGHATAFTLRDAWWLDETPEGALVWPQAGDPAVWAPTALLGGQLRWAPLSFLEVGASGDWASGQWLRRSSLGVMEIPGDDSLRAVGIHVVAGYRPGDTGIGVTLEATSLSMAHGWWRYTGPRNWDWSGGDAGAYYQLLDHGRATAIRIRGAAAVQTRVREVDLALGAALCPQFTNNGFFDDRDVPIWEEAALSVVPTFGVGTSLSHLYAGAQLWWAWNTQVPSNGLILGPGGRMLVEYRSPGRE